jgi:hypothetical protein
MREIDEVVGVPAEFVVYGGLTCIRMSSRDAVVE